MARLLRLRKLALLAITMLCSRAWADAPPGDAGANVVAPPPIPPPENEDTARLACFTQHDDAQIARRERHLIAARSALRLCSAAACPGAIRADCIEWLDQVERSVPSLVISARARGEDLTEVRVFVDRALAADHLTGAALELDPGEHQLRFESARWPAVVRSVLVSEGVKSRPIDVDFAPGAPPVPSVAAGPAESPRPRIERHLRRFDYVVGGIGLVALGTGTVAGSWGLIQHHDLSQDCAPFCSRDQVSSVRSKLVIADVSFGVAAAALLVVSIRFLRSGEPVTDSPRHLSLLVGGGDGTARLGVTGTF